MKKRVPLCIMMVGLPGSGKSTLAYNFTIKNAANCPISFITPHVHSSDSIRKELYGDEAVQTDPAKVFAILYSRICEDLKNGIDVIYDATNLVKNRRQQFLTEVLNGIECIPICIVVDTPFDICMKRNNSRTRMVPEYAMRRMRDQFEFPSIEEGFESVHIM